MYDILSSMCAGAPISCCLLSNSTLYVHMHVLVLLLVKCLVVDSSRPVRGMYLHCIRVYLRVRAGCIYNVSTLAPASRRGLCSLGVYSPAGPFG
jgi:hypothetical protein